MKPKKPLEGINCFLFPGIKIIPGYQSNLTPLPKHKPSPKEKKDTPIHLGKNVPHKTLRHQNTSLDNLNIQPLVASSRTNPRIQNPTVAVPPSQEDFGSRPAHPSRVECSPALCLSEPAHSRYSTMSSSNCCRRSLRDL